MERRNKNEKIDSGYYNFRQTTDISAQDVAICGRFWNEENELSNSRLYSDKAAHCFFILIGITLWKMVIGTTQFGSPQHFIIVEFGLDIQKNCHTLNYCDMRNTFHFISNYTVREVPSQSPNNFRESIQLTNRIIIIWLYLISGRYADCLKFDYVFGTNYT